MMKSKLFSALFFSGIHMDMLGALEAPALPGVSNPGKFIAMPGGAGLNTASIATQLGVQCAIIGLVGDDAGGVQLKNTLQKRAIKNYLTICKGKATGSYTSIIEPNGNLAIAVADLSLNEEMQADWLFENYASVMASANLWFLNANLCANTLQTLTGAQNKFRPQILTAASISPSKARNLAPSLENLDVLFTNIQEARAMLAMNGSKPNGEQQHSARSCIENFREMGIGCGSLSQGAGKVWVWDEGGLHAFEPVKLNKIADVTGAGDALAGAFIAGLAQGKSMGQMAPLAIAAAQMVIGVKGPHNADIDLSEIAKRAEKVTILA